MSRGGFERLYVNDKRGIGAFVRQDEQNLIVVIVNASSSGRTVILPVEGLGWTDGSIHRDVLSGGSWSTNRGAINLALAPFSGVWLV